MRWGLNDLAEKKKSIKYYKYIAYQKNWINEKIY